MEFAVPDGRHVCFRYIHPRLAEQLREMPEYLANLSDKSEQRFFPSPTESNDMENFRSDWKAYVESDLHDQFRSARDIVASDLRGMTKSGEGLELLIPENHIDAWLNVLNQARLALEEDFGISSRQIDFTTTDEVAEDMGLAVLRNELFIFMQECLVQHLE